METFTAFGLTLRSAFPLPGMAPDEGDDLPALDLDLVGSREVDLAWSGAASPAPWRGRLGDGSELTIEWGRDGDLLFAYGRRARFHLDASKTRLRCAPLKAEDLAWQRVLLNRVLPNASLALGRQALHASAVLTSIGVVAIAAPSGVGKSTLAAEMIRRGWPLFADDVLVLGGGGSSVKAHPASPHMNLANDRADCVTEGHGETLAVLGEERWLSVPHTAQDVARVAVVILLERSPGLGLEVQHLPSSPLVLAPYMLGLPDEEERGARRRFALYSDLIESATLLGLNADLAESPAALIDAIQQSLDLSAPLAMRGAV
ncbi:MAG: hypothetical protein WB507_09495 [Solirubrobacterales bacterium]